MSRNQTLERRAIEGLIAEGRTIVIFEGNVLQLNGWLEKHPGGKLAMLHMVGRDATDEMNVWVSNLLPVCPAVNEDILDTEDSKFQ